MKLTCTECKWNGPTEKAQASLRTDNELGIKISDSKKVCPECQSKTTNKKNES